MILLNHTSTRNMTDKNPHNDPITVDQVEYIARQKLPSNVYNYYACGADDQTAIERNRRDFDRQGAKYINFKDRSNIFGQFNDPTSHTARCFSC